MALDEAVAADGHVVVRQGGAVVGLGVGRGGQRHAALVDGQLAIDQVNSRILTVVEYFAFGIVDDNISAGLGRKSVLSCILYLAVLCTLIRNDR